MRVTQSMLTNNMLNNLFKNQGNLNKYFDQINTGKKISRPSDDPVIAMKGMAYRNQLLNIEQFKRNTGEVETWMDNSDSALDQSTRAMERLRTLVLQSGNAAYGSEEMKSIQAEVEQIKNDLIDIANTKVSDKYIFNGTDTGTKPINGNPVGITGNLNPVIIEVGAGTKIEANVDGTKVFGEELFNEIDNFIEKLENGDIMDVDVNDPDQRTFLDQTLDGIDKHTSNMVNARADLGARMNRLDLVITRLEEQEIIATKTMSDNEDVHFEEAITNLLTQESLYRASLAAGSKIIQPSLIDFLR